MTTIDRFTLTEEHLTLLSHAYVGWDDCETGAPGIDPKRPYGNSDVEGDIIDLLWPLAPREGLRERAQDLHRETEIALQIVLNTRTFKAGLYERERYGKWRKVA